MQQNILNILKGAILLERRGRAFYEQISMQTKSEAVKEIFQLMAEEEAKHVSFLSEQYKQVVKNGVFSTVNIDMEHNHDDISVEVLSEKLQNQISAASYEAAAIAAAISMEKKAIDFYADRAKIATDDEEKKLFKWLSEWEIGHLELLEELDRELVEKVWNDNSFWPY
ncbi:ferritin family protein [bacterium]|nr:ferritin family protein [bacterium]